MKHRLSIAVSQICLWALAATVPAQSPAPAPDFIKSQLESDWLRQEELRETAGNAQGARDGGNVNPEQDAAGGCDGVINGLWGFHTADEDKPWWEVDLGEAKPLQKVVIYNRGDGQMGERNTRIMVLLSEDGKEFREVYRHNGTVFLGHADKKPLEAPLDGAKARFVRLQLPGKSYFHLDEVEVYPQGEAHNAALGKPATQSSVSQWSAAHAASGPRRYSTGKVVDRGMKLAENLRRMGARVDDEARAIAEIGERLKQLPADAPEERQRALSFEVRGLVRGMALKNPLLDFDSILFVKSAPGIFPHISDQFYGWWSRPGGGVFILENFKSDRPNLRHLTADVPDGSFLRPDLSYDGRKILFAYCKYYPQVADVQNKATKSNLPEDAFYHIYEMSLDGSGRRRLTHGRYDDFDARYLPSGEIVFLSTRKGVFVQSSRANTERTLSADLPDSYVRCGGDNYRPVPIFTMHVMNPDGGNMRPFSAFENFEYTPGVAADGRILYTRWDYIDRFNGHFFSLWSVNPDGANAQLVYKNFTVRPQVACEAQSIPHSSKIVFTAASHHSITGGSLVLFDRTRGTEGEAPITRLTPEVPFPETEANVDSYYANPWPLSEEHYLVAWSDRKLPPHSRVEDTDLNPKNATGIYLYDAFGNLNLLYRDAAVSCANPIPVRPRPKPLQRVGALNWDEAASDATFFVQDVYQGLPGVRRGSVKWLRVVGVPPKTQPHMNTPNLGVSAEDPGKFLIGAAPVESDGSAYFRVPSGVPVFFQAVDEENLAIQTMRSLTYVWPKQNLGCVGCHEPREVTPPAERNPPLAARRDPSKLKPGPEGSWPLRFDRLVQPVLEKHCVSCHSPGAADGKSARFDLTSGKSYDNLLNYADGDLRRLALERDRSIVGECPARKSKLWAKIKEMESKGAVRMDEESRARLAAWMDLYAQRQGHFSEEQERQLLDVKRQWAGILSE